jgi:transcriptional regulator with XRE-family HTH domain
VEIDSDLLMRALGRKLKAARKARNLTQAQLAAKADLSVRRLGDIERGSAKNLQLKTLVAVVNALEAPQLLAGLLDGDVASKDYAAEDAFQAAVCAMGG